jgi:hypothetical protein
VYGQFKGSWAMYAVGMGIPGVRRVCHHEVDDVR